MQVFAGAEAGSIKGELKELLREGLAEGGCVLRCQTRPKPEYMKELISLNSLIMLWTHHFMRIPIAFRNLRGKIVKVYSQASKQARAPKTRVCSS